MLMPVSNDRCYLFRQLMQRNDDIGIDCTYLEKDNGD